MTSTSQDITIIQGDTCLITVTVTESGSAKNLSGASIKWQCARNAKGPPALTKTTSDGITITNAAGGICTVSITAADSALLEEEYYHEMQVTDVSSNVSTVLTGTLTVTRDLIA